MSKIITTNHCKNCGHSIENYNFCPNCGAKKITHRITFTHLVSEFADRFFNLDNSFIKTFLHLFSKPEDVIDGYINGLRKRYINAFGYFAISLTVLSLYSFLLEDYFKNIFAEHNSTELQDSINQAVFDITFKYQTLLNFLSIPLLAIISKVVFWNYKKYNFTEHLIIYLYAYSHIVSIISILMIPATLMGADMSIAFFQFPIYIIYTGYVLKRLFDISFKRILLKTLLFFVVSGGIYILLSIIAGILIVATGMVSMEDLQSIEK